MKRLFPTLLGLALAGLLAMPAQAETTLRITLQLPIKSHLGQNLLAFEEEVEAATGGEVQVEIYPSAQLYKDKEVPQAVGSGAIEMGTASITRFAGTIPAVDIFYVPFMFNNEEMVRKATAPGSPVRAPLDAAILETGTRVLWWQAYGGAIMLSKDAPLKTPDDVKGKKVRVFGKTLGEFIKAVGGAPVLTSGSEQYVAYQRGTVDAGMTGVSGVKSRKLWQVMDHITVTNHADVEFLVLINEKVWQGLRPEHQEAITAAARKVESELRDTMTKIEADAFAAAKAEGMGVYTPSDAEIEKWRAMSAPVIDQYKANAGELGAKLVAEAEKLRQ
jgi:C4-dicarboxylate-binding protein DctP